MSVRTRFAPSPTGYLHIGGVRTALFNWLFAKGQGGQFILRIDDTDAERNVEEALAPILHGLKWVGLDWDEGPDVGGPYGPYYQSQRQGKYQAAVEKLLAAGAAYRDFARTEELQLDREAAQKAGKPFVYNRRWRAETEADARRFESEGRQGVVRLLMPREGQFVLNDLVRGEVRIDWASEQDHVIQRADGTCLYHLATVVDDHDMQISHVIRAEEHLSNTPRQAFMFEKLGYELPQFAHLPFVAEPGSKTKLSKRKLDKYLRNPEFRALYNHGMEVATVLNQQLEHFVLERGSPSADSVLRQKYAEALRSQLPVNIDTLSDDPVEQKRLEGVIRNHTLDLFEEPTIVQMYEKGSDILNFLGVKRNAATFNPVIVNFYEHVGYLPDPILNYLLLLGWSLDDKTDEFSREDMLRLFSLERVNKAAASFDPKKLQAFQARAMQRLSDEERYELVASLMDKAGWDVESFAEDLRTIVSLAGDRIKVAGDVVDFAFFFTTDDGFPYVEEALKKRIKTPANAIDLLTSFRNELMTVEPFSSKRLEHFMNDFVAQKGIKHADIVHAVRVAVTGKATGFGLFDTLGILGRERCVSRINRALRLAEADSQKTP